MKKAVLALLLTLTSCSPGNTESHQSTEPLVHLVDSVKIIHTLICQNKLAPLLDDHDPEQLNLLLYNVSPAHMAFQAEVIETTVPYVISYYCNDDPKERDFIQKLALLAKEYEDVVKFVVIDVYKLFTLAEDADIEKIPTIIISSKKEVLETITENITLDLVVQKVAELVQE